MISDLFDQFGARGGGGGSGSGNNGDGDASSNEPPPRVSFKAGKVQLTQIPDSQPTRYRCEPDFTRGEIRLVYKTTPAATQQAAGGVLEWQWYDRREERVVDVYQITESGSTWERIHPGGNGTSTTGSSNNNKDRLYVWTRAPTTDAPDQPLYEMYWMQDASDENDESLCATVNQYLADPSSAAPPAAAGATSSSSTSSGMTRHTTMPGGASASAMGNASRTPTTRPATDTAQVDALSSILENLGMPRSGGSNSSNANSSSGGGVGTALGGGNNSSGVLGASTTTRSAGTGTLTLQDLQGAMASLQQQQIQQQQSRSGPALSDLVTPAAVTALLQDETSRTRLLELLPAGQQTPEHLEDNLRSPQVQQTLRSLTMALLPDQGQGGAAGGLIDDDGWAGFYSVMANFQLDPADGQEAVAANNPIQAFLDALLKSVERDQGNAGSGGANKSSDDIKDEEMKDKEDDDSKKDGDASSSSQNASTN